MSDNVRVMIVEDLAVIRQLIQNTLLQAGGFEVRAVARNGQEAVDQIEEAQPQLVLLDVVMPVMQAYEALPLLKEKWPEAMAVMLTSTSERNLVLQCRKLGAEGFIIKKDDLKTTLAERIRQMWNKKQDSLRRPGAS